MDTPTAQPDWRTVLREQGRSLTWLAAATGRPRRTVYSYHQRTLPPTAEWLAKVAEVLGVPVVEPGPEYEQLTPAQKRLVDAFLERDGKDAA